MPRNGKKIAVILGGGTSGPPLSEEFCDLEDWYTVSIAPGSDSGGNSGELRDAHGILPPGDVRRFLIAHAKDERQEDLREIFGYRFPDNGIKLAGEVGGNILALICEKLWGRSEGVRRFSRLLNIRGEVHYASKQDTHLVAQLSDGSILQGEGPIDTRSVHDRRTIHKVWLDPSVVAEVPALVALGKAKVVVFAPGDFYTSLLAILLVELVLSAINASPAKVVMALPLMTKAAETEGYRAADFVDKLFEYGLTKLDAVLVNTAPVPRQLVRLYQARHSSPVVFTEEDRQRIHERGATVLTGDFLNKKAARGKRPLIRHEPKAVVQRILDFLEANK